VSSEESLMDQAKQLAEEHGLYFRPVHEGPKGEKLAYVLYRKNPDNPRRGFRVCRRSTASTLLHAVKVAAGIAPDPKRIRAAEETAL